MVFASFSGKVVWFAGCFPGLDWVFVLETNREDAKDAKEEAEEENTRGGFC